MGKIHIFVVPIFLLVVLVGVRSEKNDLDKVIIDTDAGADDAMAILLVLQAEKNSSLGFQTIAITCTYGNTILENVERNVLKTLTIANRSDIPVFAGADKPLIQKYTPSTYFGIDGFGDFKFTEPIHAEVNRSQHAAIVLIELSKMYPGEITLLAIGPLTNIALAQRLDAGFLSRLKNLVILGGSVAGVGNKSPNVEFNFYQDPEGNWITFNSTEKPLTLIPWETVRESKISKEWRETEFHKLNSPITIFLDKAERISLEETDDWKPSDAIAAAVMIWPELITKNVTKNVTPVIDGLARGSILVDYADTTDHPKNTKIIQDINSPEFLQLVLKLFV